MSFRPGWDKVQYICPCGIVKPITELYLCRICFEIRCKTKCLKSEIDSHYCPGCLENLPSAEAAFKGNRCSNCLECPICFQTLTTVGTSSVKYAPPGFEAKVAVPETPGAAGDKPMRRMHYLSCPLCRWTSRDVGLYDQQSASSAWPQQPTPNEERLKQTLVYHCQYIGQYFADLEAEKKEEARKQNKNKFTLSQEKFRTSKTAFLLGKASARSRASVFPAKEKAKQVLRVPPLEPLKKFTVEDLENDAEESFEALSELRDLSNVSTLEQKYRNPSVQAHLVKDLYPSRKHLATKRCLRCSNCGRNVCKPEYHPLSIKFKVQGQAYVLVPEVKFESFPNFGETGQDGASFVVTIRNPNQHQTTIRVIPLEEVARLEASGKFDQPRMKSEAEVLANVLAKLDVMPVREPPKEPNIEITADMVVDSVAYEDGISLDGKNDAAEFDDSLATTLKENDASIVAWRKNNTMALRLRVKPRPGIASGSDIVAAFLLRFDYVNTVYVPVSMAADSDQPCAVPVKVRVYLMLGKMP